MNIPENYTSKKVSIDIFEANIIGGKILMPVFLAYFAPFAFIWHNKFTGENIKAYFYSLLNVSTLHITKTILIVLLGVVLHEFLHGFIWSLFAKKGFKSIQFGVMWKMLTPYCHCKEPLKLYPFIAGAIAPGIILGVIPGILSVITGKPGMLIFASFFTMAAIGDFLIVKLLWKEKPCSLIQDHPSELGVYVLTEKEKTS